MKNSHWILGLAIALATLSGCIHPGDRRWRDRDDGRDHDGWRDRDWDDRHDRWHDRYDGSHDRFHHDWDDRW